MHKGYDRALHILSPLGGLPPGKGRTWELKMLVFFQPGLTTLRETERHKCKTAAKAPLLFQALKLETD